MANTTPVDSPQLLRSTLDGLVSHVAVVNESGEIIFTNQAYRDFAQRNGIAPVAVSEHANYLAICDAAHGDDAGYARDFAQGLRDVIAGQCAFFEMEYPCHSPDEERWFLVRVTPCAGEGHGSVVVAHENITKRKQLEEDLKRQAERASALLRLPQFADEFDEKTFMQRGMELTEDLTGSSIAFIHVVKDGGEEIELVAWSRRTLEHYCTASYNSHYPVSKAGIWADALRTRTPVIFNDYPAYPHKQGLPEGHSTLQRLISVPVLENGQVVMLAGVGNKETPYTEFDSESVQLMATAIWQIAKNARTTQAVREGSVRLERLSDNLPGALYQYQLLPDGTLRMPYASGGIEHLYGVPAGELVEDPSRAFARMHPDDVTSVQEAIQESARAMTTFRTRHRIVLPEGKTIWVEGEATPDVQPDGSVLWNGYTRDVTKQVADDASLRQLTRAVEQSDVTIVITDRDGKIEYANPRFEATTGYTVPEAMGQNPRILQAGDTPPEVYAALWETVLAGKEWRGELHNRRKDGSLYWESVVISPVRDPAGTITNFVAVKEDITAIRQLGEERAKLEAQLSQAQKMESVGRLAGGVAHDFNNLLTVINGTAELALAAQDSTDPHHAEFVTIQEAAQRATTLTRQLLTFSRQQTFKSRDVSINEVVTPMLGMLGRLMREDVAIFTDLAEDAGIVRADVGQLEQVLTNLVVNAGDSMPQGGQITVSTGHEQLTDDPVAGVVAGEYVRVTVRDTGIGISGELKERIFEPFFTTKGLGKGTGLGLAIVYGIVRQCGGTVTVDSTLGAGTAFHVFLPRMDHAGDAPQEDKRPAIVRGTGVILVVDDEPALGAITQRILQRAGYTVHLARSGEEAVRLADSLPGTLDLLLSDVIMPEMSGPDVASALRARDPALRVMFVSGHSGDILINYGVQERDYAFMAKPFSIPDLTQKVKDVLTG